ESFEIDLMRLERAHAAIDMVGAQRYGMGGLAAVDQQMAGLPRLQALVSEFSENPRVVGVADRVDGGHAGIAVIDVVESPPGLEVEVRHHRRIRSELADLPRNGPPQLMGGFDQAIGEVEDLEIVDADDIAGPALFGCAQLGDFIR